MSDILNSDQQLNKHLQRRRLKSTLFHGTLVCASSFAFIVLAALLITVFKNGWGNLSWDFLNNFPSRFPARAGIKAALFGTLWMVVLTAIFSFPVGIGAAIYLEEYAKRNWFTRVINTNIANLAGIPSIIYGILGLAFFVRGFGFGRSLLAGSLTMALLILPIIIIASREAIRAMPSGLREASVALGATQWQTVRRIVVPSSFGGILTGTILAISRAISEAAPLIMIGALTFLAFTPESPSDPFTVLAIQIFNWTSRPQAEFHNLAASAIIVLLGVLLITNSLSIYLRNKYQQKNRI